MYYISQYSFAQKTQPNLSAAAEHSHQVIYFYMLYVIQFISRDDSVATSSQGHGELLGYLTKPRDTVRLRYDLKYAIESSLSSAHGKQLKGKLRGLSYLNVNDKLVGELSDEILIHGDHLNHFIVSTSCM